MCLRIKFTVFLLSSWVCSEVYTAPRTPRLSVAEDTYPAYFLRNIEGSPGTYSYGYDISDPASGNIQFRSEERYSNGTVVGSYGYVDAAGTPRTYRYVADDSGYRVIHDIINTVQSSPLIAQPISPGSLVDEGASITWTRPRKNKKKPTNYANNRVTGNKYINGFIKPPSAYVEY